MRYDCAVIGGGPAGMNATLMLGRARRKVVLLDNSRPRNKVAHASHGMITRDGVTPEQLRKVGREELANYGNIQVWDSSEVTLIERCGTGFIIVIGGEQSIYVRKVIMASGLKEIFPQVEGFEQWYGKGLFPCPFCDGWEMRDKPLVLLSEQPNLFETTKILFTWSKDLLVCTNGLPILTVEQKQQLQTKGIQVIDDKPVTAFLGSDDQLTHIRFSDGTTIERAAGFIMPRMIQRVSYLSDLQPKRTETGAFQTDGKGRTTIPGLYAAGDNAYIAPSQVVFAAADGSRTAMSVHFDLANDDF